MATGTALPTDSRHKRLSMSSNLAPIRFAISVCYDMNIPTPRLPISLGSIFFYFSTTYVFSWLSLSLFRLLAFGSILFRMVHECTQSDISTRFDSLSEFLVSTIHTTTPAPVSSHHSDSAIYDPNSITTCKQQKRESVDRCFPFLRGWISPHFRRYEVTLIVAPNLGWTSLSIFTFPSFFHLTSFPKGLAGWSWFGDCFTYFGDGSIIIL